MTFPQDNPNEIENACYPSDPVEGVDYVYDDVMQVDGTTKRVLIRRLQP